MSVTIRTPEFTVEQKLHAVLRVLKGEELEAVSGEYGIAGRRLERWRSEFIAGGLAELTRKKSSQPESWYQQRATPIKQWATLLGALAGLIGLLALFIQRGLP